MNNISIIPISFEKQDDVAQLFAVAYAQDPAVLALFPHMDDATRLKLLAFYWKIQILHCIAHGYPVALFKGTRLVGARLLYLPGQYPIPARAQWISLMRIAVYFLLRGVEYASFRRLMTITAKLDASHPKEPHLYTEIECIQPEFQGKHLYTPMAQNLFNLADKHAAGIYCETSNPNNVPRLVDRFGYRVLRNIKLEGITYWSLWRPPFAQERSS